MQTATHTVTVRPGDTLSSIAGQVLGNASAWPSIYAANRAVIGANPNQIYVGEQLRVGGGLASSGYTGRHRKPADDDGASPSSLAGVNAVTVPISAAGSLVSIGTFLMQHGYSRAAAAGICGDIEGESAGNPEAQGLGGGGLIGWTPESSASPVQPIITGNPAADLQAQLTDLLAYNQLWAQYLAQLNAASDPVAAGDIYSQDFERPAVRYSDTRPSVAWQIYGQL